MSALFGLLVTGGVLASAWTCWRLHLEIEAQARATDAEIAASEARRMSSMSSSTTGGPR